MPSFVVLEEDLKVVCLKVADFIINGGVRVVLLVGDMGAGKTTFTRAMMDTLGYAGGDVSSPTFNVAHRYDVVGLGAVFHYDLHRLVSLWELDEVMLWDNIDNGNLVIIEWPQLVLPSIDVPFIRVDFKLTTGELTTGGAGNYAREILVEPFNFKT